MKLLPGKIVGKKSVEQSWVGEKKEGIEKNPQV